MNLQMMRTGDDKEVKRVSVQFRLAAAFSVLLLLMLTMAGVGSWRLAALAAQTRSMADVDVAQERQVRQWLLETHANAVRALVLARSGDAETKQLLTPQLDAASNRISVLQKQVENSVETDAARALVNQISAARVKYIDARATAIELRRTGNIEEAVRLVDSVMVPAINAYVASIQELVKYYTRDVEASAAAAAANAVAGRDALIAASVAGLLLGGLLAWQFTRGLLRQLGGEPGYAACVARRVAGGE